MFKKQIDLVTAKVDSNVIRSLTDIFTIFNFYTKEIYLVGGCVRDLFLNRIPKDYDLCTNASPEEVKMLCNKLGLKTFDSGIKHGTITILDSKYNQSFEITTYRIDGKYTDNRHPDNIIFTPSLEEDLKRRDFTINSLAYDLYLQEVIVLEESFLQDLEFGIIRAVGNAEDRFNEDALRMLRAIRFSAQLNFSIAEATYKAICKLASNINNISKERIRDELTKILLSDNPQALELLVTTGLENYFFGITPIKDILNCLHQNPWHYTDVFHHTIDVIKRVPKTFELRWAAFFHDLGKPTVKALKPGTVDHYRYIGHQEVSVDLANQIMDILKFSNEQKNIISKFVKYHDKDLVECRNAEFKRFLADIGEQNFLTFMKLKYADAMAHALIKDVKYAVEYIDALYIRYNKIITESQALTLKDLAINGDDILADGFLQGKEIGDCLNWMLNIVLENPEYNTKERLLEYLELFKEMSFQSS